MCVSVCEGGGEGARGGRVCVWASVSLGGLLSGWLGVCACVNVCVRACV